MENPSYPDPTPERETRRLIQQLGSYSSVKREQAQRLLQQRGAEAVPALLEALKRASRPK